MSERTYFGTDGIRGRVGEYPITPDFVMKLGWAIGRILANGDGSRVLIGKDTRISGYMFESALEAGLSAAGVDILLLGPMPTPGIAYLTRTFRAQAGVVISASHNPFEDNGIKFFGPDGMKLPNDTEKAIEAELEKPMEIVPSNRLGRAHRIEDARGRYIEHCKGTGFNGLSLRGKKFVVDCAHGATYEIAPNVFRELGAEVCAIGAEPDGLNINAGCGALYPASLQAEVIARKADLGIALDGDGDRVIMVDHKGEVVEGDQILYIIADDLVRRGKMNGTTAIVGTQMSNLGLEHALDKIGLNLKRAKVGDRHVLEMMLRELSILGGESSGHIICRKYSTTGDGIVTGLQVLKAMHNGCRSLHDLKQGVQLYPQRMVNVPIPEGKSLNGTNINTHPAVALAMAEAENALAGRGRILVRPSGTEPIVRVMVEANDSDVVDQTARSLALVIQDALRDLS